jgi:hypothetical protein
MKMDSSEAEFDQHIIKMIRHRPELVERAGFKETLFMAFPNPNGFSNRVIRFPMWLLLARPARKPHNSRAL